MTKRTLSLRAAAALAALAALIAAPAWAYKDPGRFGQPAPDFHVSTIDGQHIKLADLKGQVVVLNFWATWCGPCRAELPLLDGYARMKRGAGLRVLAVDYNDPDASPQALRQMAAKASLAVVTRFDGDYRPLGAYPTSFVIDRAGVLRYAKAAAFTLDGMNETFPPLLAEPAPDAPTPAVASNASAR